MAPPLSFWSRVGRPYTTRRVFFGRLGTAVAIWFAIMLFGLGIGIAGYAGFEGMDLTDAYLNAAMILSGMGPVGELHSEAGKIFAGSYAIFSGLVIVLATGVVLSPIVHHVLHVFHADMDDDGRPDASN
ncbi:hypothetical protein NVS89_01295 [Ancylobacter sp. MQZ15Z-1]|uniref:Potassium channel domain-containing protein n=1 Tax=Ancylobacter mangrovi TaxID=2972472 RepID=A0A9X2PAC7_9HYPH|nr:hypothetical protein [Ancylobacter mangrovi]MCS0493714.1 hypothetical protein [Ancylobacter mangrovi]